MPKKQQIPNNACQLRATSGGLAVVDEGTFTLKPYTMGQRVEHSYWEAFVFEVSSMRMGRDVIPVTVDHDTAKGAGFASSMSFDDNGVLSFGGEFVDNEHSVYVKSYKKTNVMQTSLQFDPANTDMIYIGEEESTEVDGVMHQGPLFVFKNATIVEVAFTLMGAVPDTSTSFSNHPFKEITMADSVPNEAEIRTSTMNEVQAQFAKMNAICGDPILVASCFAKGMSMDDFNGEVIKNLNETNVQFAEKITALEAELVIAKATPVVEGAAPSKFTAEGGEPTTDVPDFMSTVAKFTAEGMLKSKAVIHVCKTHPELYDTFRKGL